MRYRLAVKRAEMMAEKFHHDTEVEPGGMKCHYVRCVGYGRPRREHDTKKMDGSAWDSAYLYSGRRSKVDPGLADAMGHTTSQNGRRATNKTKNR